MAKTKRAKVKRCKDILDIDTMGAQFLGQCELPEDHKGPHECRDMTWGKTDGKE